MKGKLLQIKVILLLIIILGIGLRFYGLNWDENQYLHPDERFISLTAVTIDWPTSISEYLDPQASRLAPINSEGYGSYIYGTFPLFTTKAFADYQNMGNYGRIHIVGRFLSATMDIGSLILVYFISKKFASKKAALSASALYAVSVISIQHSHFFTSENYLVFFTLLSFKLLLDFIDKKADLAVFWSFFLGISFALVLSSKLSGFLFAIIIAYGYFIKMNKIIKKQGIKQAILLMSEYSFVFILTVYIVFRFTQPYFFADSNWLNLTPEPIFWANLQRQREAIAGEFIFPPQFQWINTTPYLFPFKNIMLWGLGLPLGIASLTGMFMWVIALIRRIFNKNLKLVVMITSSPPAFMFLWIVGSFIYGGGNYVKSMRYFIAIVPFLIMFAAYAFDRLQKAKFSIGMAFIIITFTLTSFWAFAYVNIYSKDTTRIAATKWLFANAEEGSKLANEHWDDPLPLRIPQESITDEGLTVKQFQGIETQVYNPDNSDKIEHLYSVIKESDYILLTSARASGGIGQLPDQFPIMYEYYMALDQGTLGYELVEEISSYPSIFGIEINDSSAEEVFWVYDHPTVKIYKKQEQITKDQFKEAVNYHE